MPALEQFVADFPRGGRDRVSPRRSRDLVDQLRERGQHSLKPVSLRELAYASASDHDRIRVWWKSRALAREGLPKQALDAIAVDRATDLARHRQPESRSAVIGPSWKHVQDEIAAGVRATLAEHSVELCATREPSPTWPLPGAGCDQHQTVRRLRPFARRRLIVRRPARVRMRVRKPCVRARLRFFGW